jgi:serine/threonine-protein kinase
MLTAGGVKLLDFGVGKWSPKDGAAPLPGLPTLTEDGAIVGTIRYMSPEQLEGRRADARSDLFSFGAVLFEMRAGRTAFDGPSQASIIAAILTGPTPPLPEMGGASVPRLGRVVAKCLAKDPDQRWQSARDLGDELRWLAEDVSRPPTVDAGRSTSSATPAFKNRLPRHRDALRRSERRGNGHSAGRLGRHRQA